MTQTTFLKGVATRPDLTMIEIEDLRTGVGVVLASISASSRARKAGEDLRADNHQEQGCA
jgi:hypothetical protein